MEILKRVHTSPGYSFPPTVCSDPLPSSAPQWAWNCHSLNSSSPHGPPFRAANNMFPIKCTVKKLIIIKV